MVAYLLIDAWSRPWRAKSSSSSAYKSLWSRRCRHRRTWSNSTCVNNNSVCVWWSSAVNFLSSVWRCCRIRPRSRMFFRWVNFWERKQKCRRHDKCQIHYLFNGLFPSWMINDVNWRAMKRATWAAKTLCRASPQSTGPVWPSDWILERVLAAVRPSDPTRPGFGV